MNKSPRIGCPSPHVIDELLKQIRDGFDSVGYLCLYSGHHIRGGRGGLSTRRSVLISVVEVVDYVQFCALRFLNAIHTLFERFFFGRNCHVSR